MNNEYRFENRKFVILGIVLGVVLLFIGRLFYLQILNDEYKEHADSNAFLNKTIYPSRGVMYDRNGKLLVSNQPAYDVMVCMRNVKELDTLAFCNALGITREFFDKRMADVKNRRLNPGYSSYTDQLFLSQLTAEDFAMFQEQLYKFEGFSIQKRTVRQYNYPLAGHIFGDLGEVSKKDIAADGYYVQGDFIGKQGIESFYERQLRGEKGKEVLLRDAYGRVKGRYQDGAKDVAPVPGKNLTLSLDIELQELAERLLQNKIGSVVAIEPETGEVLCMASSPTFDPQVLVGRQRGDNHRMLSKNKQKPLLNRAIMGTYPPGSTFKTAQALTFLQEDVIDVDTQFPCALGFRYKGLHVGCHAHSSPTSIIPTLATSCNSYFCWSLYRMIGSSRYASPQEALTRWKDHMVAMGFGYRLGIDLPGEARGFIPNSAFYDKWYGGRWNGLTIISISIGQGEVTLTPLQIANLGATIANRGKYITPHIVKEVQGEELDSLYRFPKYTMVDKEHYEIVVQGMREAVLNGTCRAANLPGIEVCGKTGTAQNRGKDHSAFMGFAPMHNPKIAVAVYVENGGFGAVYGVPIGALLMEKYLTGTLSEASEQKAKDIQQRVIYYGNQER